MNSVIHVLPLNSCALNSVLSLFRISSASFLGHSHAKQPSNPTPPQIKNKLAFIQNSAWHSVHRWFLKISLVKILHC